MKREFRILNLVSLNLCLIGVVLLTSCESYRFANPLPVDSRNRYKTPRRLRGFASDDAKGKEGILFEKHSIKLIGDDTLKIFNGIWFHPRDTSHIPKSDTMTWRALENMKSYESRYSIKFDSVKKFPVDTVENYVMKANKIYAVENHKLSEGYPFVIKGDTIYMAPERQLLKFGTYSFFRKVDSNNYLLNIKDGLLGEDYSPWWQIYRVTKRENGRIVFFEWNNKIVKDPSFIYSGSHNYFDSQWTRKDILKLIKEEAFDPMNEDD